MWYGWYRRGTGGARMRINDGKKGEKDERNMEWRGSEVIEWRRRMKAMGEIRGWLLSLWLMRMMRAMLVVMVLYNGGQCARVQSG
ncbi:hypothetical protein SERLA73DRAFT_192053 [Serpula lacrymans var. lacrymans S7.3]|uniref:Uncharacterized protein n=1 Tax=Serpula lacrymans var. lacrymans (strain S7.3) TaxID=936435 RepID=F8QIV0_SERL3|nr:hypothetical protein SERLA73DRAFT_192053 [Serpula lacrymans var. lacrymans S7.3]